MNGLKAQVAHKGKALVPTITMTGTADMITPAGNSQWLVNKNLKNTKKFLPIWVVTADKWTKFLATGSPDTSSAAWANGTGHCQFSSDQRQRQVLFHQMLLLKRQLQRWTDFCLTVNSQYHF
jgi:hypothetical protein